MLSEARAPGIRVVSVGQHAVVVVVRLLLGVVPGPVGVVGVVAGHLGQESAPVRRVGERRAVADPADADWANAAFAQAMADINHDGIHAHIHGGFTRPAKPFNAAQQALFQHVKQAGSDLGIDIQWAPSGGVCEGNNLYAAGCPNVDSLGVRGGEIHSPDEYAFADSFQERAQLSALMLCRIASGGVDAPALRAMMTA